MTVFLLSCFNKIFLNFYNLILIFSYEFLMVQVCVLDVFTGWF